MPAASSGRLAVRTGSDGGEVVTLVCTGAITRRRTCAQHLAADLAPTASRVARADTAVGAAAAWIPLLPELQLLLLLSPLQRLPLLLPPRHRSGCLSQRPWQMVALLPPSPPPRASAGRCL